MENGVAQNWSFYSAALAVKAVINQEDTCEAQATSNVRTKPFGTYRKYIRKSDW